ncbi:MAG: SPOR domain-containing protein [Flavobacteriaceae bacterium]|nr:SPOR domain-containing protein [Flavobacteriaceae bacterium]MCY4266613.1 SPOR domain-containing protein [Flavobacteriaceae bacterium]
MEIRLAIMELLEMKNQLTVPYFGTFIIKETKASSNQGGTFYGKKRLIESFNPNQTNNDRELADFLAKKTQISYALALKKIQGSVGYWKSQIKKGSYHLDEIGTFKLNQKNRIEFQASKSGINVLENFGLPAFITSIKTQQSIKTTKLTSKQKPPSAYQTTKTNQETPPKQKAGTKKIERDVVPSRPQKSLKYVQTASQSSEQEISNTKKKKVLDIVSKKKQSLSQKKIKSGDSYYPRRKPFPIKIALVSLLTGLVIGSGAVYFVLHSASHSFENQKQDEEPPSEINTTTEEMPSPIQVVEPLIETETIPSIEGDVYAIVIGSFDSQNEANQYMEYLKTQKIEARISNRTGQSRIRVVTGYYSSVNEALDSINEIQRSIISDAWILREE